ncbi:MAG: hypothetical protein LAO19_09640 [Acidobacteriia bacterium]|nr:hypothetical protein [Terriglobia bacterium]
MRPARMQESGGVLIRMERETKAASRKRGGYNANPFILINIETGRPRLMAAKAACNQRSIDRLVEHGLNGINRYTRIHKEHIKMVNFAFRSNSGKKVCARQIFPHPSGASTAGGEGHPSRTDPFPAGIARSMNAVGIFG